MREKKGKESFTDVILKLTARKRKSLLNFAGKWAGNPEELDRALSELDELWASWSKKVLK
jgi:predicted CopG family antitoxin